jgi:cytosine/adenosine deaminase-related metal-dependent hydrolase
MIAMPEEQVISGTIIVGDEMEIQKGYICIKDTIITEVGTEINVDANVTGLVAPCFVNAHTHIADSVFKDPPISDLDSLIKPPNGLKHQVLRSTPEDDVKYAMHQTLEDMIVTGSATFCDFREGGIPGVSMVLDVISTFHGIHGIILGRAQNPDKPEPRELAELLEMCSGIGMSGVNDVLLESIEAAVSTAFNAGKMFALHAGEKDSSDICTAIGLKPDFIVHMTHATDLDIKRLEDADIPVVVCPRSNFTTRVAALTRPPIQKMMDMGVTVAVGTDNVMLNSVNMFSEMEFLSKVYGLEDRQVFKMCTLNGAKILGLDQDIGSILKGKQARLMVLDDKSPNLSHSSDMLASLIRRGRPDDIKAIFV